MFIVKMCKWQFVGCAVQPQLFIGVNTLVFTVVSSLCVLLPQLDSLLKDVQSQVETTEEGFRR